MPCLQVSCVHQGQKSCFIEHSRRIILRNNTGSPEDKDFPRVSLYDEYKGDLDISRVPTLSLADDGPGQRTGTVLPMVASEVWQCPGHRTCIVHADCQVPFFLPYMTNSHVDLSGSSTWQTMAKGCAQ